MSLEDFFLLPEVDLYRENDLQPGEIITAILLPSQSQTARSIHIKFSETESFDWRIADIAVVLDLADGACRKAALVLGAAAPIPHRAKGSRGCADRQEDRPGCSSGAADAALQGAMPLTKNVYKLPIFQTLVRRALLAAVEP